MRIEEIFKRDHSKKEFEIEKITEAILKAMNSVKEGGEEDATQISKQVNDVLLERKENIPYYVPNVEEIQDLVEQTLMKSEFLNVAKAYILYRNIQSIFDKMSPMPIITANIVPSTGANQHLSGIANMIEYDDRHRDVSQRFLTLLGGDCPYCQKIFLKILYISSLCLCVVPKN